MIIEYRIREGKPEYYILHDLKEFSEQEAAEHFRFNGHPREPVHVYAPCSRYNEMVGISERIEAIFKAKEEAKGRRSK